MGISPKTNPSANSAPALPNSRQPAKLQQADSSVNLRAPCGEPAPWIPESKLPPIPKTAINSFVRKILLTNPLFPRFYADVILATRPNSNEAKILRTHYHKILAKVNATMSTERCTPLKITHYACVAF